MKAWVMLIWVQQQGQSVTRIVGQFGIWLRVMVQTKVWIRAQSGAGVRSPLEGDIAMPFDGI